MIIDDSWEMEISQILRKYDRKEKLLRHEKERLKELGLEVKET